MNKKIISKVMSELGKRARKVHPYSKEHYIAMGKKSGEAKRQRRLSTVCTCNENEPLV
jgi:hypothetical protein